MLYFTYVLKSSIDDKLYIGWTISIKNRLKQHNSGKVYATKYRRPLKLIYYEACLHKELAIKREKQLKTGFGRKYLNNRIK
jgi:putative endonuclease